MAEIEIPFAVQAGESSSPQNSREKLVNMYAEIEVGGRKKLLRRQRAGLTTLAANTGAKRAIEHYNGTDYVIIGDTFYSFDGVTLTSQDTISSTTGRCWIIFDDNGKALISDGSSGYHWNGTTITTITMPSSLPVGTLAYQGGFGIIGIPGAAQFYLTGINDLATVDALDFATAESAPDTLLRVFVDHNQLMLCGKQSIEMWQLTGASDFPFSPYVNAQVERGICGPAAICAEDNTVMIVGDDKVVYRLEGYRPLRISTGSIERKILEVSDAAIAACEMFSYTSGGQKFITIRFENELTVQYNIATGLWNYAETYSYLDWHVMGSAGHFNRYLLTDAGVSKLNEAINKDDGGIMRRVAISAPGDANGRRLTANSLFLDAEVGRAGAGISPNVMMRFAPDGETFGNVRTRSLGLTGEYRTRVIWRNLGQGRRPVIEVSITDDVRFTITSAIANVTVASN